MINKDELLLVPYPEIERVRGVNASIDEKTAIFADLCRINTLFMISYAGSGHVGSSLSAMDIVSHLFLSRMERPGEETGDVYFSSKGHDAPGLYSVLIALGLLPFDNLFALRKMGGLPGHPDVNTPHIVTNTGSLGMGISKARGMAIADQSRGINRNYYVLLGDGELQEGQFWESLMPTSNRNMGQITAIVDHNKIQSDTFISEVSDLGDIENRIRACGWEVARVDGHDIKALNSIMDKLKLIVDKPKLILADTIKAKGAGPMESSNFKKEERLYKFHSGAPTAEHYVSAVNGLIDSVNEKLKGLNSGSLKLEKVERPSSPQIAQPQKLIEAYSEALIEQAEKNEKILALSADLALDTGLIPFEKRFPERFIECGIAEQDMVSMAGGMALRGALPFVHSFSCFLSTRPNEQIFNNATEETKIVYTGSLAGVLPGGPGHSHQSIRDIAALSGIPNLEMIEPCCEQETKMVVSYAANETKAPVYIRLVSIPVEIPYKLPDDYTLAKGKGVVLVDGDEIVIIGYGPIILAEAVKAAKTIHGKGVSAKVVNLPWLNRLDAGWLGEVTQDCKMILTLDNHALEGGQGRYIRSELLSIGMSGNPAILSLGVSGIAICGKNDEVLKAHGLDAESIAATVLEAVM